MDCFFIGRLSGSKGSVWQYTAIDVASGYTWAELHSTERNPRSRHCQTLLHRLAHELALAGWKLQTVTTDNGSEFVSSDFGKAVEAAGARQRRIKAGRPTSNGCGERVQLTILEECWRPQLRPLTRPQAHRAPTQPRRIPHLLQHRQGAPRPAHPRPHPLRHRLRCPQDRSSAMNCRVNPGLAQARAPPEPAAGYRRRGLTGAAALLAASPVGHLRGVTSTTISSPRRGSRRAAASAIRP